MGSFSHCGRAQNRAEASPMTLTCPHCHRDVEIPIPAQRVPDGLYHVIGTCRCLSCGRELVLYSSRTDQQFIDFQLVDPAREWTFEEIMDREG
jgi:hypothetical protein